MGALTGVAPVAEVRPRQRQAEGQAGCTRGGGEASCLVEECQVLVLMLSRCRLAIWRPPTGCSVNLARGGFTSASVCVLPPPALLDRAMMIHFCSAHVTTNLVTDIQRRSRKSLCCSNRLRFLRA